MDPARVAYWSRQLRPLRPAAEPIEDQWRRRVRVMIAVSWVGGGILAYVAAIFGAFGRWDLGLAIASLVGVPWLGLGWINHWRLGRRVSEYREEVRATTGPGDGSG